MDANKIIDDLLKLPDLSEADRIYMFVQLCDEQKLMNEFKKQALCQKVGMVPESVVHSFAYGVFRLAKPYLFEQPDEPT